MPSLKQLAKKASPLSIDKKIAGMGSKLASKFGDKLGASAMGTVAKQDETTGRNKAAEHKVGGTFRDIDRAGGNFTPLQVDNAIARRGFQWSGGRDMGTGLVIATTTRGPKDGGDNRYYDSDRNTSLALTGVIGGFAAAGASASSAGSMDGLYAVNSFDTGAMASSMGYSSPGWAGGSSAGLLAENAFDSGAMASATGYEAGSGTFLGLSSDAWKRAGASLLKSITGGKSDPASAYADPTTPAGGLTADKDPQIEMNETDAILVAVGLVLLLGTAYTIHRRKK